MNIEQPSRPASMPLLGRRGKRILHTGVWSMIAKLAGAANLFLTVPFVLQALGTSEFGVWATLVSLVAFAGFLDFGFGNGAMNLVAAAQGRGDPFMVGIIAREALRAMVKISFALFVVALFVLPWVPWQRLLGAPDAMAASVRLSVAAVLFTIAAGVPLNLANRVQLGLGQGNLAFRWQAIGQVLTAITVILLAKAGAGLEILVAATVATPLTASVANNLYLWRNLPASHQNRNSTLAVKMRNEGALFFCLQVSAALAFSADLPLISLLSGAEDAGTYSIVQRLFSVIPMALGLVWIPLWPVYRQALAGGDVQWASRTLRRSIYCALGVSIIGGATLGMGFENISNAWLKHPLSVSGWLIAGFALWYVIDSAGTAISTFLNAASIMRYQVVVAVVFAVVCVVGKILAITHVGVWALPWVTIAAFLLTNLLPSILLWPRLMATVRNKTY